MLPFIEIMLECVTISCFIHYYLVKLINATLNLFLVKRDMEEKKVTQKSKIIMVLIMLAGLAASGCVTGGSSPDKTAMEMATEDGTFSTFLQVFDTVGLADMLNAEGPITVFLPSDDAFSKLSEEKLGNYLADEELLFEILSYHIVQGDYSIADVSKMKMLETMQGESISISTAGDIILDNASVTEKDIWCTNGVVHVIDEVLIPPSISENYIYFSFVDGAGRDVFIEKVPERIVSLAGSSTEVIFAVGAGDLVVGRGKYSKYPPEVLDMPNLGSGSSLDMEKLIELEPDLVVMWYYYDEAIESIEAKGINVMAINPSSVQGVYDEIALFGTILNKEGEAQSIISSMEKTISDMDSYVSGIVSDERPKVYYETSKPFKTLNKNTFTGELITIAGGYNIAGDQETKYPVLSSEWIIDQDPDVIIVLSYGASVEEIKAREGWDNISAVRNERVYSIESDYLTSNPRLVIGLEQLAKWFYPEHFE